MIREINARARENPSSISQLFRPRQRIHSSANIHAQNRDLPNGLLDSDVDRNAKGENDGKGRNINALISHASYSWHENSSLIM